MIGPMGSEADVAMNREGRSCLPKNSGFKIQDPSKEEIGRLYRDDLARWTQLDAPRAPQRSFLYVGGSWSRDEHTPRHKQPHRYKARRTGECHRIQRQSGRSTII